MSREPESSRAGVPAESRLDDRTEWVHRMLNYGKDVPLAVRWYVEDVPMLREKVEALDIVLRASGERREKAERLLRQIEELCRESAMLNMPAAPVFLMDISKIARRGLEAREPGEREREAD